MKLHYKAHYIENNKNNQWVPYYQSMRPLEPCLTAKEAIKMLDLKEKGE